MVTGDEDESAAEPDEDLSDLDPAFIARLEALTPWARRALIELERDGLAILRRRAELGITPELEEAVSAEVFTGVRLRELRLAVQVARIAEERRDSAVRRAREVGYSWAELARVVGVSRQALHQRFTRRPEVPDSEE